MAMSHWKPLPADLPAATRDLAERMRTMLDEAGLSLRQFAASDDVHHSVTTLQRYFSGQALPPPQLIEVMARRFGADLELLHDRASRGGEPDVAEREPAPATPSSRGGRWRWIAAAVAVLLGTGATFGVIALRGADVTPEPRRTGPDLVVNGSFDSRAAQPGDSSGLTRWWVHEAKVRSDGGLAQVAVPGGTQRAWDVMFGQSGITVTEGKRYVLRFTAWTDRAVRIAARVQSEDPPYSHTLHTDVALDPVQKQFDYHFTAARTMPGNGQVVFQLGGGDEDYTIYLDNVSLAERTA